MPGLAGKAATVHTHTASQISDSTVTGRSVLTATDAAAARTAIGAGTGTSNLAIGTSGTTAAAGNDSRLTDTRTPTDGTVTDAKVAAGAAIALSKLATGRVSGSKNGTATTIKLEVVTEAQYNALTSNGTAEDPGTIYLRAS